MKKNALLIVICCLVVGLCPGLTFEEVYGKTENDSSAVWVAANASPREISRLSKTGHYKIELKDQYIYYRGIGLIIIEPKKGFTGTKDFLRQLDADLKNSQMKGLGVYLGRISMEKIELLNKYFEITTDSIKRDLSAETFIKSSNCNSTYIELTKLCKLLGITGLAATDIDVNKQYITGVVLSIYHDRKAMAIQVNDSCAYTFMCLQNFNKFQRDLELSQKKKLPVTIISVWLADKEETYIKEVRFEKTDNM